MKQPLVTAAVFVTLALAAVSAAGCWGGEATTSDTARAMAATTATSDQLTTTSAPTSVTAGQTTTSTLSLHERVQQEQAQQEASAAEEAKTTGSTISVAGFITVEQGKTLMTPNGTTLTPEEVESINDYYAFADDADSDQQNLDQQFELLMGKANEWTSGDYSKLRSLISSQKALSSRIQGAKAPELCLASHEQRVNSARLFVEAWQKIRDGDPGGTPTKNPALVSEGLSLNIRAIEAWHSAENMAQSVYTLLKASIWK